MPCVALSSQDLLTCGQGVTPGLATTFYFALKRQLTATPARPVIAANMTLEAAASSAAAGTFTFATGGKWGKVEGVIEISYEAPMDGGKRSKMVKPKLTAKVILTVEAEGFVNLFKNEELIIVFKDADGKLRMLGNLDFPAFMVNGDAIINESEKSMTLAFEAGPHGALVLPDTIALSFAPAA